MKDLTKMNAKLTENQRKLIFRVNDLFNFFYN
jgi:hypothetical protein